MKFDGGLLERGFWLYVWEIKYNARTMFYVGRTGDTSSLYASSPFRRIGQHLDAKANAKGNALARQLRRVGVIPAECSFEMLAFGPLFPEQTDREQHRRFRDETAALECALAQAIRDRGHEVLGTHPKKRQCDDALLVKLLGLVKDRWPERAG